MEVNNEYSYRTYPMPFICIRGLHGMNLTFNCVFIIFKFPHWVVNSFFLNFTSQKIKPWYFLIFGQTRCRVQSRLSKRKRVQAAGTSLHGSFCGTKA